MQRQRFITAKTVTEEKKKAQLIRFHRANKIDNYKGAEEWERKEKYPKEYTEQGKIEE